MLYTRKFLEDNKRENIGDLLFGDAFLGTTQSHNPQKKRLIS